MRTIIAALAAVFFLTISWADRPRESSLAVSVSAVGRVFKGYAGSFLSLAVSPDGRSVATGDEKGNVVLWDFAKGEARHTLTGHKSRIWCVAFSPDGKAVLSSSWDGTLRLWDAGTGAIIREINGGEKMLAAAFSPDGQRILTGDNAGTVKLWNAQSGQLISTFKGQHDNGVVGAAFLSDGKRAITTDLTNKVNIWDLAGGKVVKTFTETGHVAVGHFVARDERSILFAGDSLRQLDIESGSVIRYFRQAMAKCMVPAVVAFSPDGRFFIVETQDQFLNLWELETGRLVRSYRIPGTMQAVGFTPDGQSLAASFGSAGKPGQVMSWPVNATPDLEVLTAGVTTAPMGETPSAEAVALGKKLFFDPRISHDGLVSCSTCHNPNKGWTDQRAVSIGIGGRQGRRNTISVLNAALHDPLFWDGRAATLEDQVRFPLSHPSEMGSSPEEAVRNIAPVGGYGPLFKAAFGDEKPTPARIAAALAAFERTLISLDSPYDRYAAGDEKALSATQAHGLSLFKSKARCFMCHQLAPSENPNYMSDGIKTAEAKDMGRYEVTQNPEDIGKFIVPDIHNLRYTAPYMHDGSLATLADVVDFYDKGGGDDPRKFPSLKPLHLTPSEKADIVAFLDSMSGDPLVMGSPDLPR